MRKTVQKAAIQSGALTRLTASTWGASFVRSRQIYSSIIRPQLAYGAALWHTPTLGNKAKGVTAKLQTVQNKCLRTIAGAYRATPVVLLETETFTPPIDLYLDSRIAAFQQRLQNSPIYQQIQVACKWIVRRLKLRTKQKIPTAGQKRKLWVNQRNQRLGGPEVAGKKMLEKAWGERWHTIPRTDWDQIRRPPEKRVLKLHSNLKKAESAVLIQMRTGRTGLAHFLHIANVPEFNTSIYECKQA